MQALDNEFFEAYKCLDRLCSDMYGCRNGINQYIEDMERASHLEQLAIPSWERAYKSLKHLRWIRNQIAHDSGQVQICEEYDIQDVDDFYDSIMSGRDPLSQLRRYREDRAAVNKTVRCAGPASTPAASNRSNAALPPRRRTSFFIAVPILLLILATAIYVIVRFI